jgi:hypothetical protein
VKKLLAILLVVVMTAMMIPVPSSAVESSKTSLTGTGLPTIPRIRGEVKTTQAVMARPDIDSKRVATVARGTKVFVSSIDRPSKFLTSSDADSKNAYQRNKYDTNVWYCLSTGPNTSIAAASQQINGYLRNETISLKLDKKEIEVYGGIKLVSFISTNPTTRTDTIEASIDGMRFSVSNSARDNDEYDDLWCYIEIPGYKDLEYDGEIHWFNYRDFNGDTRDSSGIITAIFRVIVNFLKSLP